MSTVEAATQRDAALLRANRIRLGRAELHRQVRAGTLDLRPLIREPPEELLTARIYVLLQWLRGVGPERARRSLYGICGLNLTLGVTGAHTRQRIVDSIDELQSGRR